MPIQKVKGGYKWGESGKVYPTKAQAAKQARAAYASGYKGYQTGDVVTQSEDPWGSNFEYDPTGGTTTTVGGPRESVSFGPSILDTFLFGGAGPTGRWHGGGLLELRLKRDWLEDFLTLLLVLQESLKFWHKERLLKDWLKNTVQLFL